MWGFRIILWAWITAAPALQDGSERVALNMDGLIIRKETDTYIIKETHLLAIRLEAPSEPPGFKEIDELEKRILDTNDTLSLKVDWLNLLEHIKTQRVFADAEIHAAVQEDLKHLLIREPGRRNKRNVVQQVWSALTGSNTVGVDHGRTSTPGWK